MTLIRTMKYYLNPARTWLLEADSDGDEIWLRTEKGYQLMDRHMLEMLYLAVSALIKEFEVKEDK